MCVCDNYIIIIYTKLFYHFIVFINEWLLIIHTHTHKVKKEGLWERRLKYSMFMCRTLFVYHFWERKKRMQGEVAAKREVLNAFKFRPVF